MRGIQAVVDVATEVNRAVGEQRIRVVDIGGGLSVNFSSDQVTPTFAEFAAALRQRVPQLFSGEFECLTEYGRAIVAKAGLFVSRIAYTKVMGGRHIAAQHIGAQLALRTVYQPDKWPLRIHVLDEHGEPRGDEPSAEYDVVGPCCFAGDMIASRRRLPCMQPGDYIVVHDVGAYYISSFSLYNSHTMPPVYAYDSTAPAEPLRLLQRGQTIDDLLAYLGYRE